MRISDWSSDVCSSDLFVRDVAELLWLHTEHDPFGAPAGAKPFGERRELRETRARRGERIDDRDRGRVKPRLQPATQHRARPLAAPPAHHPAVHILPTPRHGPSYLLVQLGSASYKQSVC